MEISVYLRRLGARIRSERNRKRLSRRKLAEMAGLSERYLVELENGRANPSISVLYGLANALKFPLSNLVEEVSFDAEKTNRIALVGLRGAGKSTLGGLAAQDLNIPFLELDDQIEARAGLNVGEIFSLYGTDGYRKLELDALTIVAERYTSLILAVAGGIVDQPQNFERLLRSFHTVWIKASPDEHMQRVIKQGDHRPMENNPTAMEELRSILRSRETAYAGADLILDTSAQDLEKSHQDLVDLLTPAIANN